MKIGLVLYELSFNSFLHREVWGEDIDAQGLKAAFDAREDVDECTLFTPNILHYLNTSKRRPALDLVVHFHTPSILVPEAVNVLYFQQFYNWHTHDLREYLERYALVLTPARKVAQAYEGVRYMPLAVDVRRYRPAVSERHRNVVFIGNERMRDTETYATFLQPAIEHGLDIYGAGWDRPGREHYLACHRGVLGYSDAATIYSEAKVALSIHNRTYKEDFELATTRSFHAIACGCAVISDMEPSLMSLLPQGHGIVYTTGGDHLRRELQRLLHEPAAREALAAAGRAAVLERHTWDHRAQFILDEIRSCPKTRAPNR